VLRHLAIKSFLVSKLKGLFQMYIIHIWVSCQSDRCHQRIRHNPHCKRLFKLPGKIRLMEVKTASDIQNVQ
jgi:hypothetical protein